MSAETLFDQLPPMIWPDDSPRARLSDPTESHMAADSNLDRVRVEQFVLELFAVHGAMTDAELTERYHAHPDAPKTHHDSPRKRRSDLSKRGELVDMGVRLSPSGRQMRAHGIPVPHQPVPAVRGFGGHGE